MVIRHPAAAQLPNLPLYPLAETAAMTAILQDLGITDIHTHSLVDFVPQAPDHLLALVNALGARWEVNLHDYKVICPRINLADVNGFYCAEPRAAACNRCLAEAGSDFNVTDIGAWREMHRRALMAADQVRVPDADAAQRLGRYFPEVTFDVSPHEGIDLARIPIRIPELAPYENLRIVVIGAIGKIKGFDVLLACARHARQRRLPLEFILMGYSMNDRQLQQAGVTITGRYLEEQAPATLEALSPHVVWLPSLWPETYSYTLSIALQAGLPVMAFDIGAIARRIRECDPAAGHDLLGLDLAHRPDRLNDCFLGFRSCHLTAEALRKVG
jgi:glycosyltransferase involved in cell wall biosynthesis